MPVGLSKCRQKKHATRCAGVGAGHKGVGQGAGVASKENKLPMLLLLLLLLWVCIVFEVAQKHKTIAKVQVPFLEFRGCSVGKGRQRCGRGSIGQRNVL